MTAMTAMTATKLVYPLGNFISPTGEEGGYTTYMAPTATQHDACDQDRKEKRRRERAGEGCEEGTATHAYGRGDTEASATGGSNQDTAEGQEGCEQPDRHRNRQHERTRRDRVADRGGQ
jgi:hypothetical protein